MKETKTVSGSPETRAAMHEVMAAFEAFKGANDARLAELEKKASVDTLLEEKVARIDAAVGSAQARLDRALSDARRPVVGDGVAPSTATRSPSPEGGGLERIQTTRLGWGERAPGYGPPDTIEGAA